MPPASTREHRVDFLRGLVLVFIFINHIPGNLVSQWTPARFGFSDSAEVFVLLAGFASAQAYFFPLYQKGAVREAFSKVFARVLTLYLWHLGTMCAAIALVLAFGFWANPGYMTDAVPPLFLNVKPFFEHLEKGIVGIFTLGHQFGYFNILPMYAALLVFLPLIMFLGARSLVLLAGTSVMVWLCVGFFRINFPNSLVPGGWFFNPLAWQLIFVFGFILGVRWRSRAERPPLPFALRLGLVGGALAYVLCSAYIILSKRYSLMFTVIPQMPPFWAFDKTYASIPRLMHLVSLGILVTLTPVWSWLGRLPSSHPLTILGRHALPVFGIGSVLNLFFSMLRLELGGGVLVDVGVVLAQLFLVWAVALFLEQKKKKNFPSALSPFLGKL